MGHRLAAPLALGVGLATLYYAIAETLGGDYLRYPGNNERFFLLFLARSSGPTRESHSMFDIIYTGLTYAGLY